VLEDAADDATLGDEGDHPHHASAAGTDERIDLVHPANELGPSAAKGGQRGVVDDELQVRNVVCTYLSRNGFASVPSPSGEDTLSLLETLTVDLILIDVGMPGLDGFDTVKVLRSRPEQARVPILFMSGLPESNRVLIANQMGADFLPKPLNFKCLLGKVTAILGKL
jgi:DNA-binding response OmpR family regulator